jgi:hypothetical protein
MLSLRQACKRFCRIINSNFLTHPDSVEYGWDWDGFTTCEHCVGILTVSNFKFAKCNTIFINLPLENCCFNTFKILKSKLNTITGLVLRGIINLTALSRLLAILRNVHRLRLCLWDDSVVDSIQTARLFDRILSHLEVDGRSLTELSGLLNFPSRDIRVRYLTNHNVNWVKRYLSRHQRIVNHAEITTDCKNSSTCVEELGGAMKSLGLNVKIRPDCVGSMALEGFKSPSMLIK